MLLQQLHLLNAREIILASGSPQRLRILNQLGLKFKVQVSGFDEDLRHGDFESGGHYALATATEKALDVATRNGGADLVIGADTLHWTRVLVRSLHVVAGDGNTTGKPARKEIPVTRASAVTPRLYKTPLPLAMVVEWNGRILEKAADEAQAIEMLTTLSGRTHQVHTGVALVLRPSGPGQERVVKTFFETTDVVFEALDRAEIESYVRSGEAFGKAGAYGIQGLAGAWVSRLEGCYFNVMGFPLHRFAKVVSELIADGTLAV